MSRQDQQSFARRGIVNISYADLAFKLRRDIEDVENATESKFRGKDGTWTRVLLIGVTGGGKTTLLYAIVGEKLIAKENEKTGFLYYDAVEPLSDGNQEFTIGNTTESETYIPNVWVDSSNKIIYVDCPGFLDTETDRRLINAFSIDKVLSNAETVRANVKVLFVVSEKQLSEKALTARQALDLISKMFPNEGQLRRAVGVVVTKTSSPRVKPVGLLKQLQDRIDSGLLDKFISDGEQRVFSFPSPYDVGIPSNPIPVDVRDRLSRFLESDGVSCLSHMPAIESDAEKMVIGLSNWITVEKCKAVNILADGICEIVTRVEEEGEARRWLTRVDNALDASNRGWKDFSKYCKDLCRQGVIDKAWKEMEKLVPMEAFIAKMIGANSDAAVTIEKNKTMLDDTLYRFTAIKGALRDKIRSIRSEEERRVFVARMKKLEEERRRLARMKEEIEEERRRLARIEYDDDDDDWCLIQ